MGFYTDPKLAETENPLTNESSIFYELLEIKS